MPPKPATATSHDPARAAMWTPSFALKAVAQVDERGLREVVEGQR